MGFFSLPLRPDRLWGPTQTLIHWVRGFFPWAWSGRGVKLTIHLHLVPRLWMSGAIRQHPQYVFMAWCVIRLRGNIGNIEALRLFLFLLNIAPWSLNLLWIIWQKLNLYVFLYFSKFPSCALCSSCLWWTHLQKRIVDITELLLLLIIFTNFDLWSFCINLWSHICPV
jgi:hypothetical protein